TAAPSCARGNLRGWSHSRQRGRGCAAAILARRRGIAEQAVDLGLGSEPVVQLVSLDVSALRVKLVGRLTDHPMPKIGIDIHSRCKCWLQWRLFFLRYVGGQLA